jgi:hypothetical protein
VQFRTDAELADFVRTRMPAVSAGVLEEMAVALASYGHGAALQALLELLPPGFCTLLGSFVETLYDACDSGKKAYGSFAAVLQSKWADLAEFQMHVFSRFLGKSTHYWMSNFIKKMAERRRFAELLLIIESVLVNPAFSDVFVADEYKFTRVTRITIIENLRDVADSAKFVNLIKENIEFASDEERHAFMTLNEMQMNANVHIQKLQVEIKDAETRRNMYFGKYITTS